jgi:xanthine dehydrogenase small subunit
LDAVILLSDGSEPREIPLKQFYRGYKELDKRANEYLTSISFKLPSQNTRFNFEKVSKRTHLDIASVNTALKLEMDGDLIADAHLTAGGVAPVPAYLFKTSAFLKGKTISEQLVLDAVEIAQAEISPIGDARGTGDYKRLLLSQLIKAHFVKLFPELEVEKLLEMGAGI